MPGDPHGLDGYRAVCDLVDVHPGWALALAYHDGKFILKVKEGRKVLATATSRQVPPGAWIALARGMKRELERKRLVK